MTKGQFGSVPFLFVSPGLVLGTGSKVVTLVISTRTKMGRSYVKIPEGFFSVMEPLRRHRQRFRSF